MPEPLTSEQIFTATDFTSLDSIVTNFPSYVQEVYGRKKANIKNQSNVVDISPYTMETPYKDMQLLVNTTLHIEPHTRQCLYGANGTGKTLLFEYMSQGKIKDFPKHLHVHHCKELENHELSESVLNTVVNAHPYRTVLVRVEKKLEELIAAAEADPEFTAEKKQSLKDNKDYIKREMNTIQGYNAEERAQKMLRVLGFDEFGQKKLVSELSGGLRMRVALCMAFMIDADLLLMDEPTNHLDFPSVLWLENRLRGYKGSFILVSHDRELLNNVCTSVGLMEDKVIRYYTCGFKEFERKKGIEDKKKSDEIEKFLEKNRNADPSTMTGRLKDEKKRWQDAYNQRQVALAGKFTFPAATPLQNKENLAPEDISLINLQNVRFSYKPETNHFIFNDPISFNVTASTRCGVMGPNGAGKSTLLKLLTHKLTPTEGTVTDHPNFILAYFGQHSTAELDLELTPLEWMATQFPKETAGALRNHLSKTGVTGTSAETRMKSLNYSQRSCVIFAKLTYICPHLLILDEPTNFLDLESVDSLISACNKYKGALLLVSHNRDFLKKCAKTYLSVVPGQFLMFDNLKTAERSTYSFIAEMEEGGKVGASALANNPGGGTIHASQKVGAAAGGATSGALGVIGKKDVAVTVDGADGIIKATPAAAAAATPAVTYTVGEKVDAMWTDGKWYKAVVKTVSPGGKYAVTYTEYGNTTTLPSTLLKKLPAGPVKGAPNTSRPNSAAPKAAAGKQQQSKGKGK